MNQMSMFKTMVGNVFQDTPIHPKSHVRGWAAHWAEMIGDACVVHRKEDSMEGLDTLFYDHGVNAAPGKMNLFSGITDAAVDRIEQVLDTPHMNIVSLDFPMPVEEYAHNILGRVGATSTSKRFTGRMAEAIIARLQRDRGMVLTQDHFIESARRFAFGDSHATAYAAKGEPVLRNNGLTLAGALKRDAIRKAMEANAKHAEQITIVLGSIDVRHHFGLKKYPETYLDELASELTDLAFDLSQEFDVGVTLTYPVPVEAESRKIPKTGWLNDAPFMGSQKERDLWTSLFCDCLDGQHDGPILAPPKAWYDMPPADYAAQIMELSSSVHIAPPNYRRHGGWRE